MRLLARVRRTLGSAMILITHDLGLVAEYCDRVYVMYAGELVEEGSVFGIFAEPRHPYTRALVRSVLNAGRPTRQFEPVAGQPPDLIRPPSGCRFHPRCADAMARCEDEPPPRFPDGDGRWTRCWLHETARAAADT